VSHVLIADDSAVVRTALEKKLKAAYATVTLAASSAAADAIDVSTIDAALLDLDLGDGSGVELALRLVERRPELRVAFFSSADDVVLRARAEAIGPVFSKPNEVDAAVAWLTRSAS